MQITAKLRYLRLTPRKVRQIADAIRGKKVIEAQTILQFLVRRPVLPISKLLKSAIASARNNFQLDPDNLYISKITVDEGPKLKRWRPVSRGTAHPIWKRTSHITLILEEIKPTAKKKKKTKKTATRALISKEISARPTTQIKNLSALVPKTEEKKPFVPTQPRFERKEIKKPSVPTQQKGPGVIKRIFRRKAI